MSEEENNIRFVELIEKYPCLYNYNLSEYSSRDVTEKAWREIAEEIKSTVSLAKYKWKNLTSVFVRKRKLPPSGSGKKGNIYMDFIIPFIKTQNTGHGNVPSPPSFSDTIVEQVVQNDEMAEQEHNLVENEQDTDSTTTTIISKPGIQRKRNTDTLKEVEKSIIDFFDAKKQNVSASETSANPRRQFL